MAQVVKQTIKEFFSGEKSYYIPVYQRAYSWDEYNLTQFLEDIKEASGGKNSYFFGNVSLEINKNSNSDIIDGQQRITTILIFIRALLDVLPNNSSLNKDYIKDDFLEFRGVPSLNAIEYDKDYFMDLIIKGDDNKNKPITLSQERIKIAKKFFKEELKKIEISKLEAIYNTICDAELIVVPFENKKDSVLMFELQNNRGKSLTNMEKLKSFLSYQIYIHSDNAEYKLKEITAIFEEIYRILKDIKTEEDSILRYFNISKFDFNYRENDPKLNYKWQLKSECKSSEEVIVWINNYTKELKNAFFDFKQFEVTDIAKSIAMLDRAAVYPFVIRAYAIMRDDQNELDKIFRLLEIMAFRDRIAYTRADLTSKLNSALKFKNADELREKLSLICTTYKYWNDERLKDNLIYIDDKKLLNYIFIRYENFLRQKDSNLRGYIFENNVKNPQIEHISPQTQDEESIANGYNKYDDEFYDSYLDSIGNKVLIAGSHNASISNKPFSDKLKSYENTDLMQLKEIKIFTDNAVWDKEAIDKRHEKLEDFILKTWSF